MTVSCCYWNHDGSLLAIAGTAQLLGEDHDSNVVQFFNPYGQVGLNYYFFKFYKNKN